MKKLSLLVLFTLYSHITVAQTADGYYVDIKCYTELLGGGFMIHRNYNVSVADLKNYQVSLKSNNEAKAQKKDNQRKVIYKVLECRKMHEIFKHKAAAKLDKLEEDMG